MRNPPCASARESRGTHHGSPGNTTFERQAEEDRSCEEKRKGKTATRKTEREREREKSEVEEREADGGGGGREVGEGE